jgi:hypothetical protein
MRHLTCPAAYYGLLMLALSSTAQGQIQSARDLVALSPDELTVLYRGGRASAPPTGWVPGQALVRPGTPAGPIASQGAALVWQGKRFREDGTARNRFFGLPIVEGRLALGESWLDGQPSIVLDYSQTSRVYRPYRDEIREVAPGVFLGLMYDRRNHPPRFVRFFALQAPRS